MIDDDDDDDDDDWWSMGRGRLLQSLSDMNFLQFIRTNSNELFF